jgi:beta-glucosidase
VNGKATARTITPALLVTLLALMPAGASAEGRCGDPASRPWCDTSLPPGQRAELLLAQMTDAEKISLLGGDETSGVLGAAGTHTGTMDGIERLGIPTIYLSDGPAGVRSGQATAMPSPIALGASFDPKNSVRDARVIADEVIKKGNDIVFAPTVDIVRTPLAGRVFEALGGEDPYLSSRLAVPWIKAVQDKGLIANVKHYAANNQEGTGPDANDARPGNLAVATGILAPIGNRTRIDARIDERTMRELYLPMFEAAVKEANVASVMCAYNKVNGPFACENKPLLEDILRGNWGFKGMTIADYGAAHDAGASLNNGLDIEPWPGTVYGPASLSAALATGPATMADVDRHAFRYLRTLFAYGAMDRAAYAPDEAAIDQAAAAAKSRRVAEEGMVLLKNDGLLPLKRKQLDSIAVIGPGADAFLTGGGSSEIKPFSATTPFEGITNEAGPSVRVATDDGADPARAAQLAGDSDVAVVVAASYSSEGIDRTCLTFECPPAFGDQDALIEQVAAANPKTVVVIESGGPVLTPWSKRVSGVLEAWYPGSEGGAAIARVLFGKVDASGRLPVTFPKSEADLPTAGDENAYPGVGDIVTYDEGLLVGYRHYDANGIKPAYPFGHGLSYTKFRFSDLRIQSVEGDSKAKKRGGPTVSIAVTNTGNRRGIAVPQLYLSLPSTNAVPEPPKALKGFGRIELAPEKTKRVRFGLDKRAFSYWAAGKDRWQVVRGCARVLVGSSSRKTPLKAGIERSGACQR